MTNNNHPSPSFVSLDRLHQISEILSKAAAQSDGGNLGCAMADAVKVIAGAIAVRKAEPEVSDEELNDALILHHLKSEGHSQLSDSFRAGFRYARRTAMLQAGNSPVTPDGWIPVSERMPERDVDVQVYCADKKEQMVGYMERNETEGWFRFASLPNGGGVYCKPTHWMSLPAAPQQAKSQHKKK